jgi:hypothetical protein
MSSRLLLSVGLALLVLLPPARAFDSGTDLRRIFVERVDRRLEMPAEEEQRYALVLSKTLASTGLAKLTSQFFVLVDRDPKVQAVMIFWKSPERDFQLIGASPASTGKPGEFEHFETPTGVFEHSTANLDFRAEGTKNEYGIRGYGRKGMRVYDFGWQEAVRGWGSFGESFMRLQMHSTDPDMLEPRVGSPQSKGCIRIPATLNVFIDHYGILDADYERATAEGKNLWVLRPDREPTPWSGSYLVIVDSELTQRPDWSPPPLRRTERMRGMDPSD